MPYGFNENKTKYPLTHKSGEYINIPSLIISAALTGAKMNLQFTIPLTKPIDSGVSDCELRSGYTKIRQGGKYIAGSANTTVGFKEMCRSPIYGAITPSGVTFNLHMENGYSLDTGTNNDVCIMTCDSIVLRLD